jgi:elongation factor 2 kinase
VPFWTRILCKHLNNRYNDHFGGIRYNPLSQEWAKDECVLKMEETPFAHGAMRECYRMKKLSNFSHNINWLRSARHTETQRVWIIYRGQGFDLFFTLPPLS